jgi:hypothetical protein
MRLQHPLQMSPDSPYPTSPNARVRLHCANLTATKVPNRRRSATAVSNSGDAMFASSPIFAVCRSPSSIAVAGRYASNSLTPAVGPLYGRWSCSERTFVLEPLLLPRQAPATARLASWRRPPGPLSSRCLPSSRWSCSGGTHFTETHPPPSPSAGGRLACSCCGDRRGENYNE